MPAQPQPLRPRAIRLLIVEDHGMVAEAIALALGSAEGVEVVGSAQSIAEAVEEAGRVRPDVVILDRRLPDGDGIAAIEPLTTAAPGARVLMLTGEATVSVAARVAEAGGAGLMLKSAPLRELESGVRAVAAGSVVFSPDLLAGVLDRLTGRVQRSGARLTERERETLFLLGEGASTDQISDRLGVARNTARNHVQRVLEKLGARSKLEAVVIARREGIID
ncbi:response regulator transcription factor [Microbispora sp. ATCC PTA-5024]|uniref:response regulator transcription factor n=1 Tax=Microbispora sp. ATCC PTA-5024 TaxID=316330 RepID=UPI0003DBBBB4|nr:response regulator transcription factor [Microbispora sp. ATCC PTA-5024]ETK37044.1 transcriptional regulator [Microbispora sp. ATCC PTA-5024]